MSEHPYYHQNEYWYNYSHWWFDSENRTQLCAYNDNVSCITNYSYNDRFRWRVVMIVDCKDTQNTILSCESYFFPEECNIYLIYPQWNSDTICPCCHSMCLGVENEHGHTMNITWYRNDSQIESFYQVNQLLNVSNGTYCFCIDGHYYSPLKNYYPMTFNTTYFWYANVTDTVNSDYEVTDTYFFTTAESFEDCPCGGDELIEYISEEGGCRGEIVSSPGFETLGIMTSLILIGFILYKKKK